MIADWMWRQAPKTSLAVNGKERNTEVEAGRDTRFSNFLKRYEERVYTSQNGPIKREKLAIGTREGLSAGMTSSSREKGGLGTR